MGAFGLVWVLNGRALVLNCAEMGTLRSIKDIKLYLYFPPYQTKLWENIVLKYHPFNWNVFYDDIYHLEVKQHVLLFMIYTSKLCVYICFEYVMKSKILMLDVFSCRGY